MHCKQKLRLVKAVKMALPLRRHTLDKSKLTPHLHTPETPTEEICILCPYSWGCVIFLLSDSLFRRSHWYCPTVKTEAGWCLLWAETWSPGSCISIYYKMLHSSLIFHTIDGQMVLCLDPNPSIRWISYHEYLCYFMNLKVEQHHLLEF